MKKILSTAICLLMLMAIFFSAFAASAPKAQAAKDYPNTDFTVDYPLQEFSTPIDIYGDYDETLGFKMKLTAYVMGSAYTSDTLWEKVYYDLLYKTFQMNSSAYEFSQTTDEVQEIEKWITSVIFDTVELIGQSNTAFRVASTATTAINIMTDAAQGTMATSIINLKPVIYLAENASNKNIKNAAQDLLSMCFNNSCSNYLDEAHKELVNAGINVSKELLKDCTNTAIKEYGDDILVFIPRLLPFVNLTLTFKDLIFFATGTDAVLDAYINITAGHNLWLELYDYNSSSDDREHRLNSFKSILFVTKDIYNNFKSMMGEDFAKIINNSSEEVDPKDIYENDELLQKEYEALNAVTADNYYKRHFDRMTPSWKNEGQIYIYPEQKTCQIKIPGIRYGVQQYYEAETSNNCLTIDKKTGLITLTGKEGTGTIGVAVYQNGKNHTFYIPVKVAHVQDCAELVSTKYTSSTIELKWSSSYNAQYYALYMKKNNAWSLLKDGLTVTSALLKGLKPGTDYQFAVRAYSVVNGKTIKCKNLTTLKTATGPTTPENFKKKNVTDKTITVTWNASKGASYYRVFVRNTAKNKWDTVISKTTSLSATLKNLKQNTNYLLAVRAYYVSGKNTYSSESFPVASVTTAGVPNAPTNLKVASADKSTVTLEWTKGKHASGYYVYRYDTAAKKWKKIGSVKTNKAKIAKLSNQTVYKFAVRSFNDVGTKVILSKTYPTVKAVTGLGKTSKLTASDNTTTSLKLTWSKVKNASGYRVYRYNNSTKKWVTLVTATNKCSTTLKSLTSGTVYKLAVRAYFDTGNGSQWANSYTTIQATTLPGQVKNLKATVELTSVSLKWDKVARADGYVVYTYNPSSKKYTAKKTVKTNSANINDLDTSKTYYYAVKAYKKCNDKNYYGKMSSNISLLTPPSEKEAAYLYNKAYTVAEAWFDFPTKYVNFKDRFYRYGYEEYVRVNHPTIKTRAKLIDYLEDYFSSSLVKNNLSKNYGMFARYVERNGKLYVGNPNCGDALPTYYLNTTTAYVTKYTNTTCTFRVSTRYSGGAYGSGTKVQSITFVKQNNKWVIANGFEPNLYSPYIWDGKSPLK